MGEDTELAEPGDGQPGADPEDLRRPPRRDVRGDDRPGGDVEFGPAGHQSLRSGETHRQAGIADVVLHPVRLRVIQQLGGREVTTSQLRDALPDVAQATLYRHVGALVRSEIVVVVGERRVRGAVERTLALGPRMAAVDHEELATMDAAQLRAGFLAFLAVLAADFDRATADPDPALRSLLGFGRTPVYVRDGDLEAIQAGLAELLAPYLGAGRDGANRLSLTTVLIPDV